MIYSTPANVQVPAAEVRSAEVSKVPAIFMIADGGEPMPTTPASSSGSFSSNLKAVIPPITAGISTVNSMKNMPDGSYSSVGASSIGVSTMPGFNPATTATLDVNGTVAAKTFFNGSLNTTVPGGNIQTEENGSGGYQSPAMTPMPASTTPTTGM